MATTARGRTARGAVLVRQDEGIPNHDVSIAHVHAHHINVVRRPGMGVDYGMLNSTVRFELMVMANAYGWCVGLGEPHRIGMATNNYFFILFSRGSVTKLATALS